LQLNVQKLWSERSSSDSKFQGLMMSFRTMAATFVESTSVPRSPNYPLTHAPLIKAVATRPPLR